MAEKMQTNLEKYSAMADDLKTSERRQEKQCFFIQALVDFGCVR